MLFNKLKLLNASQLKYFAAFLMFFDHIHQMFYDKGAPIWLTWSGRLVFPIFMFLAADSFFYTRNRKAYMWRLLLGTWFMSITSMIIQIILPSPSVVLMNNAFGTFFVSGIFIVGWDKIKESWSNKNWQNFGLGLLIFLSPLLLAIPSIFFMSWIGSANLSLSLTRMILIILSLIPNALMAEGGLLMVLLGFFFYVFREKRLLQILVLTVLSALVFGMSGIENAQWMMIFSVIPMLLYNGKKGNESKWFFYIFYPTHIYLLYIIATVFF